MTTFIAMLSSGKGTWGHVNRVMQEVDFENIILVTNDFGKENFKPEKDVEFVVVEQRQPIPDMTQQIIEGLKGKVKGNEVALNMVSGTGKEHMALLSAIMQSGLGFRMIALTKDGVKEI